MALILLIEDDAALGAMVRNELEIAGYSCTWAETGAAGLVAFGERAPELVLLDLMLPDHSGFVVLEHIRQRSQVPVIVLTARHVNEDKVRGLDLGADDYVTKPFWTEELLARIRARLRRNPAPSSGNRRSFGRLAIDFDARTVTVGTEPAHLSPTELDLLGYLVERAGRAVRSEQLIESVLVGEEGTRQALQTHMSRLRKKLGDEGGRILTVWGIGYRFDEGGDA